MFVAVFSRPLGDFLTRTQIRNRREAGGWSVSGVALAVVFPTCAVMHAIHAMYWSAGVYAADTHVIGIDIAAVPAAAYFLWVVHGLYRNSLHEWNSEPADVPILAG